MRDPVNLMEGTVDNQTAKSSHHSPITSYREVVHDHYAASHHLVQLLYKFILRHPRVGVVAYMKSGVALLGAILRAAEVDAIR